MDLTLFQPHYGAGQVLTATDPADEVSITLADCDNAVCLTNQGSAFMYVLNADLGDASAADYCLPPGAQTLLRKNATGYVRFSYFCATTCAFHIIPGNGSF